MYWLTYSIWIGGFFGGIAMMMLDAPFSYLGLPIIVAGGLLGYRIARTKGPQKSRT